MRRFVTVEFSSTRFLEFRANSAHSLRHEVEHICIDSVERRLYGVPSLR